MKLWDYGVVVEVVKPTQVIMRLRNSTHWFKEKSARKTKVPRIITPMRTTSVDSQSSLRPGQEDFLSSVMVSVHRWRIAVKGLVIFRVCLNWREKRGSNPQPTVLETVALPIELFSRNYM